MDVSALNVAPAIPIETDVVAPETQPVPEPQTTATESKDAEQDKKPSLDLPSQETIKKSADEINKIIKAAGRELDMRVHKKTGQLLIKVINTETGDVVREIPPEKTLDFLASVLEHAGILVNKNA